MLNTLHNQSGVTAVELMIGLVIIAILLAIGAPSLGDWVQNTRIHTTAESIMNGLQLARAEAVRRNTAVRFQLAGDLTSACVLPSAGPNWVVSQDDANGKCNVAPSDTVDPRIIQKQSSAEGSTGGISVSTSEIIAGTNLPAGAALFTGTLIFNGLGRVSTATLAAGDNAIIDIENPNAGNCISDSPPGTMRCLSIVVSSGGQVRMCNPALSSPNPQGC